MAGRDRNDDLPKANLRKVRSTKGTNETDVDLPAVNKMVEMEQSIAKMVTSSGKSEVRGAKYVIRMNKDGTVVDTGVVARPVSLPAKSSEGQKEERAPFRRFRAPFKVGRDERPEEEEPELPKKEKKASRPPKESKETSRRKSRAAEEPTVQSDQESKTKEKERRKMKRKSQKEPDTGGVPQVTSATTETSPPVTLTVASSPTSPITQGRPKFTLAGTITNNAPAVANLKGRVIAPKMIGKQTIKAPIIAQPFQAESNQMPPMQMNMFTQQQPGTAYADQYNAVQPIDPNQMIMQQFDGQTMEATIGQQMATQQMGQLVQQLQYPNQTFNTPMQMPTIQSPHQIIQPQQQVPQQLLLPPTHLPQQLQLSPTPSPQQLQMLPAHSPQHHPPPPQHHPPPPQHHPQQQQHHPTPPPHHPPQQQQHPTPPQHHPPQQQHHPQQTQQHLTVSFPESKTGISPSSDPVKTIMLLCSTPAMLDQFARQVEVAGKRGEAGVAKVHPLRVQATRDMFNHGYALHSTEQEIKLNQITLNAYNAAGEVVLSLPNCRALMYIEMDSTAGLHEISAYILDQSTHSIDSNRFVPISSLPVQLKLKVEGEALRCLRRSDLLAFDFA